MVSVTEAADIIFSNLYKPVRENLSLPTVVNRVLAEKITADRDFPPFDRVSMDGIAIQYEQFKMGRKEFNIDFTHAAGDRSKRLSNPQCCVEVMTGAVLPGETDTVIRYEDLEIKNKNARIINDAVVFGQNVHKKGIDCRQHDVLLEPGIILSPAEIALLASVGKDQISVYGFPKTAIISGGDELVDIKEVPLEHQIRRSNTYALGAAMQSIHWATTHFHFPDDKDILTKSLKTVLDDYDTVILSGGVSKGKFDFIPKVLEELGVQKHFHQVNQRPGKPFWFGTSKAGKTVFALPGNPVSTYMCYYRYIKPWILKSLQVNSRPLTAELAKNFSFAPSLTYFLQVSVVAEKGILKAFPDAGGGSGDFVNLKNVTGFLELPADKSTFHAGEVFPYYPFRNLI